MAELGASQAAKGLQKWTIKTYKISASWLTGVVEMASARFVFSHTVIVFQGMKML